MPAFFVTLKPKINMSVLSVTQKFQKITVPADTQQHELDFSGVDDASNSFDVLIQWVSGTAIQISDQAIDSSSGTLSEDTDKIIFHINKRTSLNVKGGAGSETFNVNVV